MMSLESLLYVIPPVSQRPRGPSDPLGRLWEKESGVGFGAASQGLDEPVICYIATVRISSLGFGLLTCTLGVRGHLLSPVVLIRSSTKLAEQEVALALLERKTKGPPQSPWAVVQLTPKLWRGHLGGRHPDGNSGNPFWGAKGSKEKEIRFTACQISKVITMICK